MARGGGRSIAALLGFAVVLALVAPAAALVHRGDATGAVLYQRECAPCHGNDAHGDGPEGIYFAPPPRDLREGFLEIYSTDEIIDRIRRGRRLMLEVDPVAVRRRAGLVEQIVRHMQRLPDVDWDAVEHGAGVYADRCEICHGPFGRAAPGMPLPPGVQVVPRDLSAPEFQKSVSDAQLIDVSAHGKKGMPGIPPLLTKEEDRQALLAYLRLLSPGFETYSLWCAGCHGDDGRGEGVYATSIDKPDVVFDRAWLEAQDPEELRRNAFHMLDDQEGAMPHFERELTAAQARAIVEYLKAISGPAPTAAPTPVGAVPTPKRP